MAQPSQPRNVAPLQRFTLQQGTELLTHCAGLALVGLALNRFAQVRQTVDRWLPKRSGLSVGELVIAYVGLLCLGKSDFYAIENHRQDSFFAEALGLSGVPAASTLRMQLDTQADALMPHVDALSVALLQRARAPITPLAGGLVPLDIDVFTLDNSRTRKDGVSRTYAGTDGFAPMAGYLGQEGWCLGLALRDGGWHSAKETGYTLERLLPRAQALTTAPLLVRWDSGFHALPLAHHIEAASLARQAAGGQPLYFLVKGNPRGLDITALHAQRQGTLACLSREGKRLWVWETQETHTRSHQTLTFRRLHRLIERTVDRRGQLLIVPELEYAFWGTTLPVSHTSQAVIELYQDHGTHEQCHSEYKTDLDLERLPSGKFVTNDLILSLAMLAYNVLRLMGQSALLAADAPVRHPAKRRRLKTVIQELITVSAKCVKHARMTLLNFGRHCPLAFVVLQRLYGAWSTA